MEKIISKIKWPGLLAISIFLTLGMGHANEIQFNTDLFDVDDRDNIDLSRFTQKGYIMPGRYTMSVRLNNEPLFGRDIDFFIPEDRPDSSQPCLTAQLVNELGLRESARRDLQWWHEGECLDMGSLRGMQARGQLSDSTLVISIPQAFLEYQSANWDPPSRWDEGIPGLLFDYNFTSQARFTRNAGEQYNLGGTGGTGANFGPWRLRANWQGRRDAMNGTTRSTFDWTRYYAARALPHLGARLVIGEADLPSDIFDSFRFAGASMITDDTMLPPNLRGYAPEITGVARTNARVVVMHQGRVLYQSQVAAGPFRIQDIDDSVLGMLDVRVEEEDGTVQTFTLNTATIPYLTRPGQVRYKMALGRPVNWQHHVSGPEFISGEFSWGVNNGWSLYGGLIGSEKYQAIASGIGRDLLVLGAMSFDATHAVAHLPWGENRQGNSYRLSYSKRFDDYGSQVTFAGYRFSERQFMTMDEYLDAQSHRAEQSNSREMYSITLAQDLRAISTSAQFSYNRQTYWDRPESERYSLALSRYIDVMQWKNISLSLSAWRNRSQQMSDKGIYLALSLPFGNGSSVSYSGSAGRDNNSQQINYYQIRDNNDSYSLNMGTTNHRNTLSGYYLHEGSYGQMTGSLNVQQNNYQAIGATMKGGITATAKGMALHRQNSPGGTRLLLDTDGVVNIPVRSNGGVVYSNNNGKLVISDISNYYRNQIGIDINALPENAEVTSSIVSATLTEGAIGYRQFSVVDGMKAIAVIRLSNGAFPPFGAQVMNARKQEVGLVAEDGVVYLSGLQSDEQMSVYWAGQQQCQITLPELNQHVLDNLLLPCIPTRTLAGDISRP
ncbi:outer membrane usher protein [Pseudomonas graminis]